jgi:aldehyde dehydrogenase (NAD+)
MVPPYNPTPDQLKDVFKSQQDFFRLGKCQEIDFRISTLRKLKQHIKAEEGAILMALAKDLGKPQFEAYASEIGLVYEEINHTLKHLKSWAKAKKVKSPLSSWPSKSYVLPQAKGVCLIMGPWNYPFMLIMAPLCAALGAGNTAFIKPAEQCPQTSAIIRRLIEENFDSQHITVLEGDGHIVIPPLLEAYRFDHIFFTGSTLVGRKIAKLAADKLSPCTLELGGKSPAIIDATANLKVSADRIAFGKWLNAGQTCVAPDYLLVQRAIFDDFLEALKTSIRNFYPQGALKSADYSKIINQDRFNTLKAYLEGANIAFGGEYDAANLRMEPTLILEPNMESPLMKEEIFGPLLPLFVYDFKEEAQAIIAKNPNPLALYIFSESREAHKFWTKIPFGGGAINNATVHLANPNLPFGGIGSSGNGNYHGQFGFNTFSHHKALMKTSTWFDFAQKYPPYGDLVYRGIKRLMS